MIYLVKCGEFHKIGFTRSKDANSRIKEMMTGNPLDIVLVDTWPGSYKDEEKLHVALAHRRHRGEWFGLSDADLEWLQSVKATATEQSPSPEPPPPAAPPTKRFPDGLRVDVEHCYCNWCARPLQFTGSTEYLTCFPCNVQRPMARYLENAKRRKAVYLVMQEHALP